MRASIRYSLARILIFLGCLGLGWLLGLRDSPLLLLLIAATASMLLSVVLLRGMREEFSRDLATRVVNRQDRARHKRRGEVLDDAAAEDAEDVDDTTSHDGAAGVADQTDRGR